MAIRRGHPWFKDGIFAGYPDYRYGTGEHRPISLAGPTQEKPIYSVGKRKHLVSRVMDEMEDWRASPFEKEGPFRAALRASLCLSGHSWTRSDAEAAFLVGRALKVIGIPRPSWDEGQPGQADSPDRCTWCAAPVEDAGNGKASRYCSTLCAKAALEGRDFARRSEHDRAFAAVQRAIKKSRTADRLCVECGATFKPIREKSTQRFCSFSCGAKGGKRSKPRGARSEICVVMACAFCGGDFPAQDRKSILCSNTCKLAWAKLREGRQPIKLRAHVFDRYITSRVDPPAITPLRFDFAVWQSGGPPVSSEGTHAG